MSWILHIHVLQANYVHQWLKEGTEKYKSTFDGCQLTWLGFNLGHGVLLDTGMSQVTSDKTTLTEMEQNQNKTTS